MKTRIFRIVAPLFLFAIIGGISSCTKDTDAKVLVKVVEYEPNQVSPEDTIISPVVNAQVRFYNDERVGTAWLEEILLTNSEGVAEFIFPNPAILKYDVTHAGRSKLEQFVVLEQGKTVEVTVNLSE
jgi:hypothetical protein